MHHVHGQDSIDVLTVIILDDVSKERVKGAKVRISGYLRQEAEDGSCLFDNFPLTYDLQISVEANGYSNYSETIRIKDIVNKDYVVYVKPIIKEVLKIYGTVSDTKERPIGNVKVTINIIDTVITIHTTIEGIFSFTIPKSFYEGKENIYYLSFEKSGYKSQHRMDFVIPVNNKPGRHDIILAEEDLYTIESPKVDEKDSDKKTITGLTISAVPELSLFFNEATTQLQLTNLLQVNWNLSKTRRGCEIGIGYRFPYKLSAYSTYETIIGDTFDVITNYIIKNNLNFSFRYNLMFNNSRKMQPFIFLSFSYDKQKPDPDIIKGENHEETIDSFNKWGTRIGVGVSHKAGAFYIDPFISFSTFNLNSQNFIFNYFGRANSTIEKSRFYQVSMGVNIFYNILYKGHEE